MKLGPYDITRKFRPTVLHLNPRILYDLALALRILFIFKIGSLEPFVLICIRYCTVYTYW